MVDPSTLLLFGGAVLLLPMSPGPNMAFVIAHGASYGCVAAWLQRSGSGRPTSY